MALIRLNKESAGLPSGLRIVLPLGVLLVPAATLASVGLLVCQLSLDSLGVQLFG